MRSFRKFISLFMIIALLVQYIPNQVFAESSIVEPPHDTGVEDQNKTSDIVGEIKQKREKNVKHYLKEDLTYEAAVYKKPVHYKENGEWKDIDNSLKGVMNSNNKTVFTNKQNSYKVHLANNSNANKLVTIKKDGYEVSWSLNNTQKVKASVRPDDQELLDSLDKNERRKTLTNLKSIVDYKQILPNVDLSYEVLPNSVKENIILQKPVQTKEFTFTLNAKKLIVKLQEDKTIAFFDEKQPDNKVFEMTAPFMYDATGALSKDISVDLTQNKKHEYQLTVTPSQEWLSDSSREYPVTVDPTMSTSLKKTKIYDNHVSEGYPNSEYKTSVINKTGYGSSSERNRTFIKFDLPELNTGHYITNAYFRLFTFSYDNTGAQVNVHKVKEAWDTDTINWVNQPQFNSSVVDYQMINGDAYYDWEITEIAQEWYSSGNNNGLMLKNKNENANYTDYYSSNTSDEHKGARPQAVFQYQNNSGLENYWTYHAHGVGRAGTGYINDANGNLVFIREDMSYSSERMPVSIKHVYNSNDKQKYIGYGPGWRLNLTQTVEYQEIDNTSYYVYTDENGTKHYLKEESTNTYKDETGINLTLTVDSASTEKRYVIEDKKDNQLTFNTDGKLTNIVDPDGNTTKLLYSNSRLYQVQAGANHTFTLDYYSNNQLKSITDENNNVTNIDYSGNSLTITSPSGKASTYMYDNQNNLDYVEDSDGYRMDYSYYNASPYRVKTIEEKHVDSSSVETLGKYLNIEYQENQTVFTDYRNKQNIYQFNDYGNTVSIQDDRGYAKYFDYNETPGVNKNKLTNQSQLQRLSMNHIMNHNIEQDGNWDALSWSGSTANLSLTSEDSYIGNRSLKIDKTNQTSRHYYSQAVTLEKGKTYTFSGYVKTEDMTELNSKGASLLITYQDDNGDWLDKEGRFINGTNDWKRYEVTFTLSENAASDTVNVRPTVMQESGVAYFDALQIEEGHTANRYNLIENTDVSGGSGTPAYWTENTHNGSEDHLKLLKNTGEPLPPEPLDGSVYQVKGEQDKRKFISQTVHVSGEKDDVLVFGGWAKGDSVPLNGRRFSLEVGVKRNDGTYLWERVNFNQDSPQWQHLSGKVIADAAYQSVTLYAEYYYNENTAYFDGLQLYREPFSTSYQYDSEGNIKSTKDLNEEESEFKFDSNNDLIESVDPKGSKFEYDYDDDTNGDGKTKHHLESATSATNVKYSFGYDSNGNPTTSRVGEDFLYKRSYTSYSDSGHYLTSLTNPTGNSYTFDWNESADELNQETDPKGNVKTYQYDDSSRITYVEKGNSSNTYTYKDGRIKTVTHNTDNDSGTDDEVTYTFSYDQFGNKTNVQVGNQTLVTKNYEQYTDSNGNVIHTGRLESTEYQREAGVTDTISYQYNPDNQVTDLSLNGASQYKYSYNRSGLLGYHKDLVNNRNYHYYYDLSDRLSRVTTSDGFSKSYDYDKNNQLKTFTEVTSSNDSYQTSYHYDRDNREKNVSFVRLTGFEDTEYFQLNGDLKGSKGTNPESHEDSYVKDTNGKSVLAAYETTTNLLDKPSFEEETSLSSWSTSDWNGSTGVWRAVNDGVDGGTSLENVDGDNLTDGSTTNSVAQQNYNFSAETTNSRVFTLSAQAKRIGSTHPKLSVQAYDSSGSLISGSYSIVTKSIPENEWTKISESFSIPSGTKTIKVMVRSSVKDNDIVRFDNIQFEESPFSKPFTTNASLAPSVQYDLGVDDNAGTMSMWFKTSEQGTKRTILSNKDSSNGQLNVIVDSDDKVKVTTESTAGTITPIIAGTETIQPGQWYFVTVKWINTSSTIDTTLFVNDVSYTGSTSDFKDFSGGITTLGSNENSGNILNGHMEQFTYSDLVLSNTSVLEIYDKGRLNSVFSKYDLLGREITQILDTGKAQFETKKTYTPGESGSETNQIQTLLNQGKTINGVQVGGDFTGEFFLNENSSGNNAGEIAVDYGNGTFKHPNGTKYNIQSDKYVYTTLEGTGSAQRYLMFIGSDSSRFNFPYEYSSSKAFISVKYQNGLWYYDDNNTLLEFSPDKNDVIVGEIIEGVDGISELVMYTSSKEQEIQGVAVGGIFSGEFRKNENSSGTNAGEIAVHQGSGTYIHPDGSEHNINLDKFVYTTLEGSGNAERYLMFIGSEPSRFNFPYEYSSSKSFISVSYMDGSWYYDNNDKLVSFTPNEKDAIVANIHEGTDGISELKYFTRKNNLIAYTYDANGNIKTITRDGKSTTYYYNVLNELIREDNEALGKTVVYEYDDGGNILNRKNYNYTEIATVDLGTPNQTTNYVYDDAWQDKLTSFDGIDIEYDSIGNPKNYNGYNYSWGRGDQLQSIKGNGVDLSFKYNDSGIRTEKKSESDGVTKYRLEGNKVTYQTDGTDEMYFTYDSSGELISMNLNNEDYYYVRNAQGDIIGILDESGTRVVTYQYDTWGQIVSITGSKANTIGQKNPYRYRGYRYDSETGLYYLNARYYNPEWGRFLNADSYGGSIGSTLSHNAYAYSMNNPVNLYDPSGYSPLFNVDPKTLAENDPGAFVRYMIEGGNPTAKVPKLLSNVKRFFIGLNRTKTLSRGSNTGTKTTSLTPKKLDLQFFGRSEKIQPDKTSTGSHTVFQRHGETGAIKKYQTFQPQSNPNNPTPWESVKRFDTGGGAHFNTVLNRKVPTPHVHDPLSPGGVRAPYDWEIPRVK